MFMVCDKNDLSGYLADPKWFNKRSVSECLGVKESAIKCCPSRGNYEIETDFNSEFSRLSENAKSFNWNDVTRTWDVLLKENPNKSFYEKYTNGDPITTQGFDHNDYVHRGHYLAHVFYKFLVPSEHTSENNVTNFFGKGNPDNIHPQSASSNCDSPDGMRGQLYYERAVANYLKKKNTSNADKRSVLYEIQNVMDPRNDDVSLGRRILIISLDNKKMNDELNYHVFIPNIFWNQEAKMWFQKSCDCQ